LPSPGSEYEKGFLFVISIKITTATKELAMASQGLKQWFPQFPNSLNRAPMAGLMCAGALLLGVVLAGASTSITNENAAASPAESASNSSAAPAGEEREKSARIREGDELVEQTGKFGMSGNRVVFIAKEGQRQFIALENLSLERVANIIDGNPAPLEWIVSGKISQYRGVYYLLLSHARHKSPSQSAESKP
jgi:hypothetical protein